LEVGGWKGKQVESLVPKPRNPEVPKFEVPKMKASKTLKKNEVLKIAEPNESSENPLESKCLLFLLVLVINVMIVSEGLMA
jgi:hypothetical protein